MVCHNIPYSQAAVKLERLLACGLFPCPLAPSAPVYVYSHEPARHVEQGLASSVFHMLRSLCFDPSRPGNHGTRSPGPELGSSCQL
jgi:hypothetical protein